MSRFKHYLEVATGMQVADPATIAKEANTVAVETGTRKLNTMFNYYQQRIYRVYDAFLTKKEKELTLEKDKEKAQKIKETIMGIKGLGKRGIGVDGLNLDNVKRDFPDLLPAGSIDDLQNTTTYGGFIKVISDLQRESNSRVKMIRDSTFAEIDKKSKEMGLSEEVIRKQKSIVDASYSNLIRETLDKK